jgi:hypothetical protein
VLVLVPAAVLVLFLLAAITFDHAHLYLAQRELAAIAESVANDAAASAVDQGALRAGGEIRYDQSRADGIAALAVAAAPPDLRVVAFDVRLDAETLTVVVTASAEVEPVFLRAAPGGAVPRTVRTSAHAVLRQGSPQEPAFRQFQSVSLHFRPCSPSA